MELYPTQRTRSSDLRTAQVADGSVLDQLMREQSEITENFLEKVGKRSLAHKELVASIKHEGRTIWTDRQGASELHELEKEARRGLAHLQKQTELGG